jgi:hypothetical protein
MELILGATLFSTTVAEAVLLPQELLPSTEMLREPGPS